MPRSSRPSAWLLSAVGFGAFLTGTAAGIGIMSGAQADSAVEPVAAVTTTTTTIPAVSDACQRAEMMWHRSMATDRFGSPASSAAWDEYYIACDLTVDEIVGAG